MNQISSNLLSSLTFCVIASIGLSLSCKASVEEKPERELITRQSEPFVPRVKRPAADPFEVSDELYERVESVILSEADSNTVGHVVGLQYGADRVVIATHMRYPASTMEEEGMDAAVDEEALARCDELFSSCAQGFDDCDDAAYDDCVRSAYSDPHVYASMHLGLSCAVMELSRFAATDDDLRLMERVILEELACDVQTSGYEPAAQDVDLDGGPELAFAYSFTGTALSEEGRYRNVLTIADAEDLHVQARLVVEDAAVDSGERRLMNLTLDDRNGDGLPDLVTQQISTLGEYCPDSGWTTSPSLLRANAEDDVDTCEMRVVERFIPYDPTRDVWDAQARGSR